MNNETIIKVPLSKEEIKIIRTALTYFDRGNDYGYAMQIVDILNTLTSVEHTANVLQAQAEREKINNGQLGK
jgi:hypothetical protein